MEFTESDVTFLVGLQHFLSKSDTSSGICIEILQIARKIADERVDVKAVKVIDELIKEAKNG